MHHLGISLYPEHSTPECDEAYMAMASDLGFDRIFTCLLSVKGSRERTIEEFGRFMATAHGYGFEVAVDTNPEVFSRLGATPADLSPFAAMGVDTVRLDGHFDDRGDIQITRNSQHIRIQYNASSNVALDLMIERGADPRSMCVCHNFFPERFTGLGEGRFRWLSRKYRAMGLPVAAFVTSREEGTFGPWDVYEGLPTCEDDRTRPIDLQVRHLLATGLVDDVLIGNCFASKDELASVAAVDMTRTTFRIELAEEASEEERRDLVGFDHMTRTDASDYLLRSSIPREAYRDVRIPARPVPGGVLHRGDVMVVNDNLEHYRGEVQVALRDVPDDGTRNLVGRIPEQERFLLDYVLPEYPFGFVK